MRAQFVFSEIGIGLRRNLTMTIAVIVSVALSLTLAGAGLLLQKQANEMKGYWFNKIEVSIFLCSKGDEKQASCAGGEVTQEQRDQIKQELESNQLVAKVYYESKQQAFEQFKETKQNSPLLGNVTPDQLPESYRVKLKDPTKFDVMQSAFAGRPGVYEVNDQRELLEPFFNLLKKVQWGAYAIMVFMLIVAVLLIVNTARVSAFSRRRETGIMRLVGASNFYIQAPFIMESVIAGLVGALLSGGLLSAGYYFGIVKGLKDSISMVNFIPFSDVLMTMPLLIIFGVLMSAIASFVTLRKYLKV
jgi:cell division transport system permease protein